MGAAIGILGRGLLQGVGKGLGEEAIKGDEGQQPPPPPQGQNGDDDSSNNSV